MARSRARPPLPQHFESRYVKIHGLRQYQQKLIELGDGMAGKGAVYALAGGANLMRDAVRQRVPILQQPDPRRRPGVLRSAITAMRVETTRYAATFVVGIRLLTAKAIGRFKRQTGRGSQDNPNDPFYGTILEFGKTPRTAHPSIRPGFQASGEPALRVAFERLREFTLREINRLRDKR